MLETILRTGRIPIDLQEVITTSEGDPGLADGDVIYVPTKPRTVTVVGAVNLPSPVIWRKNQSAQDYIGRAGGLTKDAEEDEVMVLKVNGELHRGDHESDIGPGDLIIVPNKAIVAEPDAFDRFLSALQTIANGAFVYRSLR